MTNCLMAGNAAYAAGGGAYSGTLVNCSLTGNTSRLGGGGGASGSILINCLLAGNFSSYSSGGAALSTLINCTVVSNVAAAYAGAGWNSTFKNSVVYYNNSYLTNADDSAGYGSWTNCCTSFPVTIFGANNITNPPQFASLAAGDYHLMAISPCVNSGNNAFVTNSTDLDGNTRVVGGVVDIGAYEFPSPVHYVKPSIFGATPVSPYTNWMTAATNIQDAIVSAMAGDFVIVSNGTYTAGGRAVYGIATNRVVVDKALTLQSLNGPNVTIIVGSTVFASDYQIRCVYLTNGATLAGFTLSNGASRHSGDVFKEQSGGGVWSEDNSATISNCVLSGNTSGSYGGGVFRGTLINCILTNNSGGFGGAACSNVLINCRLTKNVASQQNYNSGGGAFGCTLSNCVLVGNICNGGHGGGGAYSSTLTRCVVSNNVSVAGVGGGVCFGIANNSLISSNNASLGGGAYSNILNNCILKNNYAWSGGGGAYRSALVNCTVVSNTVAGGGAAGGLYGSGATNCIVYYNAAPNGINHDASSSLAYCDTFPAFAGSGNITNEPVFVNPANGDLQLQPQSPCIDAGDNGSVQGGTDLGGNARIIGNAVDMGAYEFPFSFQLFYAWLQQYGLPADGSANFIDSDGDGLNNWQEWRAGTNPTNSLAVLQIISAVPANNFSRVNVTWQSVGGVNYFVQRGSDLSAQPIFSTLQSNIVGQADSTTYLDTSAVGSGPYFYRVGVQ